jgi:hypothetical protein
MTPDHKAYLGRCWADAALGEHASVAAFAHLVLHMMNLGAPPSLLQAAIRAMKEEVQHAQLCFRIAKNYLGYPVGPGPLDLPSFSAGLDEPQLILAAAIAEGCIDESVSTYFAREACEACLDPEIRVVLNKIVVDEDRHSDLSWNFVRWMLDKFPKLQAEAEGCFVRHLANRSRSQPVEEQFFLEGHGILSRMGKTKAERRAVEESILPKTRALFGHDLAFG